MIARRPGVAIVFLLPALVLFTVIVVWPLIQGIQLSFTDSRGGPVATFSGLDRYIEIVHDESVAKALQATLLYSIVVVVVQNAFGLAMARALYYRPLARKVLTTAILLPSLVAPVMAAFIFSYIYEPEGALNTFLGAVGLESLQRVWLGDPSTALLAVASVNIWTYAGYSAIIFLAGYSGIDAEVLDAAQVDGAKGWSLFRHIEWPLLAPSLTVNVTLSLIGTLKVFEYPLVLTGGGPAGSTTTLTMIIFRNLFGQGTSFAFGVALSVVLLVLVVVIASLSTSVLRARERRLT